MHLSYLNEISVKFTSCRSLAALYERSLKSRDLPPCSTNESIDRFHSDHNRESPVTAFSADVKIMILLCLSTICLVLILMLVRKIHWTANYWKKRNIPHESYTSFLHYFFFRQKREDIFDMLEEYTAKYGQVYGTYRGFFTPTLRISSTEGVKDALLRNFSDVHGRTIETTIGSPLWDNNILALNYPKWKMVRQLTSTVLTGSKLKLMKDKIERVSKRLTGKLEKLAKTNSEIALAPYAQGVIMDAIAAVTFSLKVDALEDPNNVFIKNCTGIFNISFGMILIFSFPKLVRYLPFVEFPSRNVSRFFTDFSKTLLEQRRQSGHEREEPDVLDVWLETQKNNPELTDDMLVSQMFIFFLAGYETSSYTLMLAMYLLATHPKKQEEIYRNIMDNVSDPSNISYEELSKMKLLEACIFETLRLYPTDYVIERLTMAPCTLAGVPMEAGINVQVPVSSIHRDPERFYEPLQFRPERFVENGSNRTQDIIAFGDGPKNCVGQRLAVVQLMIVLSAVLRSVRLEPADGATYDPSVEYQRIVERLPGEMFMPMPKETLRVKLALRKEA